MSAPASVATKKSFLFRATEQELGMLSAYAASTGRTQSDVMRELLRSLERKVRKNFAPPDHPARTALPE